jgi:predicted RNase H-like HicB family nuclease
MDFPTLQLTCTVKESGISGIYVGRINEIGGIFAQGDSPEEVYSDLMRHTYLMLPRKQEQVLALLQKQTKERWAELLGGQTPAFKLQVCNEPEMQAA